jgi:hypothetical protein
MVATKFTVNHKGKVTSESAVAKALGGHGPLTVGSEHVVVGLLPDLTPSDGSGGHITCP